MRIRVADLIAPHSVTITGDEAWLAPLYKTFGFEANGDGVAGGVTAFPRGTQRLVGSLTLTPIDAEPNVIVHVTGQLTFLPDVNCARCDDKIPWPISAKIDVYFEPPAEATAAVRHRVEVNLREDDLSRYHYENDQIDIEALLNDTIQTHIPSQTVSRNAAGDQCLVCGKDLSDNLVYREDPLDESPFAVLKR